MLLRFTNFSNLKTSQQLGARENKGFYSTLHNKHLLSYTPTNLHANTLHLLQFKQQCLLCGKEVKIALSLAAWDQLLGIEEKGGPKFERIHTVHLAVLLLPAACKAEPVVGGVRWAWTRLATGAWTSAQSQR